MLALRNRFKEAGNLLCSLGQYNKAQAVEYYCKGNAFMEAIRECMKEQDEDLRERHLNQAKIAVNLAFDVKKNQFVKILDDFDKRYLRLKIVQHTKRNMP